MRLRLLRRSMGTDTNKIFVLSCQLFHMSDHDLMGRSKYLLQRLLFSRKMRYIIFGRHIWQYLLDSTNFKGQVVDFIIKDVNFAQ
ncbi:hypothetical protein N826_22055 [Skermanella aerolata KACC 11604]|nr:hypothetical protein N826_22055 [Skermanella aerolata KACC 11604]